MPPPPLPTSEKQRGPRSLKRMALAVALRNINSITDLGEMTFADARPLLNHVENPNQLHQLELNCPQLAAEPEQMGAVWTRLLSKKFPDWDKKDYFEGVDDVDSMSWFDVYTTVKDAIDRDMAAATARLQQALGGFDKAKESNATQLVNSRALLKKMPGMSARRRGGGNGPSFTFGGGTRTKMTTGQTVLKRARREATEIHKVSQLSTPTGHLRVAQNQIRRPPEAMVNDHRVAHQPDVVIRAPGRKRPLGGGPHMPTSTGNGQGLGKGNAALEARLLALKKGPAGAVPQKRLHEDEDDLASNSYNDWGDVDDDDDEEGDDLFGDVPKKKPRLTVEDLEGGPASGSPIKPAAPDRKVVGSSKTPSDFLRSKGVSLNSPSKASKTLSGALPARRSPEKPKDKTSSPQRRLEGPLSTAPDRAVSRPMSSAQLDGPSPSKSPSVPPPSASAARKKAPVDIFMRPKKR